MRKDMARVIVARPHIIEDVGRKGRRVSVEELPKAQYRAVSETRKVALKPWRRNGPTVETEVTVRRLVSSPVMDAATGTRMPVGPEIDDTRSWQEFRKQYPDGRYPVSKRQLATKELRRHGVTND